MKQIEVNTAARLDGVYSVFRKLQATHDTFETRCQGTGGCCKVGLFISLAECWNIAKNIDKKYWIDAEDRGFEAASVGMQWQIDGLVGALHDTSWDAKTQEQDGYCVFMYEGCSIYEFRPAVCRAYGVTSPVQSGVCKRRRLPDGNIELIRDENVEKLIEEFDDVIEKWGQEYPDFNYSIYMPAGVLKFLLPPEELQELIATTDPRFWQASPGYKHQMGRSNWQEVEVTIK